MSSLKSFLLSTAMRRVYWVAVLGLPIAMLMPWSDAPGIGFALGVALGLAGGGLVVSLSVARRAAMVVPARSQP